MKKILMTFGLLTCLALTAPASPFKMSQVEIGSVSASTDEEKYIVEQMAGHVKGVITGKFVRFSGTSVGQTLTIHGAYIIAKMYVDQMGESAVNWWLDSYGIDWTWLQLANSVVSIWNWPLESLAPQN